jgi:deuterolysin
MDVMYTTISPLIPSIAHSFFSSIYPLSSRLLLVFTHRSSQVSKMKLVGQLSVAALASVATAASVDVFKRETPLKVELFADGNSQVKVVLTNSGETTLNLLSTGTFLDEANPVEKVTMYANGGKSFSIHSGVEMHFLSTLLLLAGVRKQLSVRSIVLINS